MRFGIFGAAGLAVAVLGLSGCSTGPQDFTVAGVLGTPGASEFANTDPKIDEVLAQQICADGYEKLDEKSIPADKGSYDQWTVRCTPYHVRLF